MRKRARVHYQPWAKEITETVEHLVQMAAGFDPIRAKEIRWACTLAEVVSSLLSKNADTENVGYEVRL